MGRIGVAPVVRCYISSVPTARPRHTITETEAVGRALDTAQRRWPDERNRQRLLLRLIEEGDRTVRSEVTKQAQRRTEMIKRASGAASGMYKPGYMEELRDEWPT